MGTVLGYTVPMSISICSTYEASIDFTLFGSPYTFVVTAWQSRGLRKYLELFHMVDRDPTTFGVAIKCGGADGEMEYVESVVDLNCSSHLKRPMSQVQKLNAIEQGCRDILACLNQIGEVHLHSLLEYCIWYRETQEATTYSKLITKLAANCVVHSSFVAPMLAWKVVEF